MARYDGLLSAVPDPGVLLSPLSAQEAVLSSRIEGTEATMGEVLQFEDAGDEAPPERRNEIGEVVNYRRAMWRAEELLGNLPLSQRLIKETHKVLLSGVRGQNKSPGEYRRVPNWIGPPGCSFDEARFIPIGAGELPAAMDAWERYLHEPHADRLVQLAILHAEFEALHPFLDGNGRLGRMMVPLFMWQTGLIGRPAFYVSGYFEARRDAYYDRLLAISSDGAWTAWCVFFLEALKAQAEDNLTRARAIVELYDSLKPRVVEATRSQYAIHALDRIFTRPVFRTTDFVANAGIPVQTAKRILAVLRKEGILDVLTPGRGRRASLLWFPELMAIAEGRAVG